MKKIKKIGSLVAMFFLSFYNTCFADAILPGMSGDSHGLHRFPPEPEPKPLNYILIGILVLVIVICSVIIIRRIIKKKKEKSSDNK